MLRRTLVSLLVSALFLACGEGKSPVIPEPDPALAVAGVWTLQTVDGHGLPYTLPPDGNLKADLTGEVITLKVPNSMTMVTSFIFNDNGRIFNESDTGTGTYTVDGATVTMTFPSDGTIYKATVSGNTMTLYDPDPAINLTFVYRRN